MRAVPIIRDRLTVTVLAGALGCVLMTAGVSWADDLIAAGNWPALATDRTARQVGDSLTVIVLENSTASNSAQHQTGRTLQAQAQASTNSSAGKSVQLGLNGALQGQDQTGRTGQMVAQISVVVDAVLSNGDLQVEGAQRLTVDGQQTLISVKGRVRPSDITAQNTVLSSRVADAIIDYDGDGFANRGSKPGPVSRVMNWLGRL